MKQVSIAPPTPRELCIETLSNRLALRIRLLRKTEPQVLTHNIATVTQDVVQQRIHKHIAEEIQDFKRQEGKYGNQEFHRLS